MTTVTTRAGKGSALTHTEMDTNFTNLRDNVGGTTFPKAAADGIKIDETSPDWGWRDIIGPLTVDEDDVNKALMQTFRTNIKARCFGASSEAYTVHHIPHDYALGTDIFFHYHWAHSSATLTGGSVTWGAAYTYAKGHDQAAFSATKLFTVAQNASTTQYQHMIAEAASSVVGGSATQIDTSSLEPDGVIHSRVYLDSNDLTDSVSVPDPFLFLVDVHYQSTGIPTKQKAPDFYI